jgi:hypothetical protein
MAALVVALVIVEKRLEPEPLTKVMQVALVVVTLLAAGAALVQ